MQLMTYSPINLSLMDPAGLDIPSIVTELDLLAESLPKAREELAVASAYADRIASEWEAGVAQQRRTWGDKALAKVGTPEHIVKARDVATAIAERVAEWEERQVGLANALRERLPAAEADLARRIEGFEEDEREIAARETRLRELTDALVSFEGYETVGGRLAVAHQPLIGRTDSLRSQLFVSQRDISQHRGLISRARGALAAFERRAARELAEVAQ